MNNIIIKKEDYERYKIPISFLSIFPKVRKRFLWEELEKRHPCFSDDFCYSSKNCISKKGFFSDVVVMEKSKLSEYKNKCSFFNNLTLEESEKINVFGYKKITIYVFIFLLAALITGIGFFYFQKNRNLLKNKPVEENILEENEDTMENYENTNKHILNSFFNIVNDNKGTISSFTWNISNGCEKIISSLVDIYPEPIEAAFPDIKIPIIKYEDKEPVFAFNYSNILFSWDKFQGCNSEMENINLESKENIRNFLKSKNIKMIEETSIPYGISFECPIPKNSTENICLELCPILEHEKLWPSCISVTPLERGSEKQKFLFYITFSGLDLLKNNILSLVGENFNLFFTKKSPKFIPAQNNNNNLLLAGTTNNINKNFVTGETKIGEILYKNGRKIVFYKNNQGKILRKELCCAN